jgi:hypothetical protein
MKNIDSHGREWITKSIKGTGVSRQATKVDGRWFILSRNGYPNQEKARAMHPTRYGCILDQHSSGLVSVLCRTNVTL